MLRGSPVCPDVPEVVDHGAVIDDFLIDLRWAVDEVVTNDSRGERGSYGTIE